MNKKITNNIGLNSWLIRGAFVSIILAIILLVFIFVNKGPGNTSTYKGKRTVTIEKENGRYRFYKNGQPFIVKGGAGHMYIKELAESGGNTISCWDTSKLAQTFEEAAKYGVSVIIGLDIPGGEETEFYKNEKYVADFYNAYSQIVLAYKDHPSLLAWCLGNELLIPFSFTTSPFYKTYNSLLDMIHHLDPNHPVSTAVINIPKRNIINLQWRVPALDFISINTYNQLKLINQDLNKIKIFWNGPYLVGEWAPNGGWEAAITTWEAPIENTSTKKAEQYYELFAKHMPVNDPRFLGSLAFYWGNRQEYTYSWYSVFNEEGTPTEIKEVLNDCWKETLTQHKAPRIQYMLVDSMGAHDNIIVSSRSEHSLSLLMEAGTGGTPSDSLHYHWQILKEEWKDWGRTWKNFKKPAAQNGLLKDSTLKDAIFVAPSMEGPYRVYVTVYNSKGYCATANTPIYVVE